MLAPRIPLSMPLKRRSFTAIQNSNPNLIKTLSTSSHHHQLNLTIATSFLSQSFTLFWDTHGFVGQWGELWCVLVTSGVQLLFVFTRSKLGANTYTSTPLFGTFLVSGSPFFTPHLLQYLLQWRWRARMRHFLSFTVYTLPSLFPVSLLSSPWGTGCEGMESGFASPNCNLLILSLHAYVLPVEFSFFPPHLPGGVIPLPRFVPILLFVLHIHAPTSSRNCSTEACR